MLRVVKLVICILFIALGLWACSGETLLPLPSATQDIQNDDDDHKHFYEKALYWEYYSIGGSHYYAVFDNNGNEILREHGAPGFTMIDENLLRVDQSGGTGLRITRFFDVEQGLYSPEYGNVLAIDHRMITYLDQNDPEWNTLVLHDMFDPEMSRYSFQRDFKLDWNIYVTAEFLDENHLYIEYNNSKDELVKETLELK